MRLENVEHWEKVLTLSENEDRDTPQRKFDRHPMLATVRPTRARRKRSQVERNEESSSALTTTTTIDTTTTTTAPTTTTDTTISTTTAATTSNSSAPTLDGGNVLGDIWEELEYERNEQHGFKQMDENFLLDFDSDIDEESSANMLSLSRRERRRQRFFSHFAKKRHAQPTPIHALSSISFVSSPLDLPIYRPISLSNLHSFTTYTLPTR